MIFALTPPPQLREGQELSAQDLNNLAQNALFLEQVAKGPTKLFLAHWRLAPPYFRLLNYDTRAGDIEQLTEDTADDRYFIDQNVPNLDVWEGSFLYRPGMRRLKLAFQTYPLREPKTADQREYQYLDGIDLSQINSTYYPRSNLFTDSDISLYMVLRYTDVPIDRLLRQSTFQPYVRQWSYSRLDTATQPGTQVATYKFTSDSGQAIEIGTPTSAEYWKPNFPQLSSQGYHTYELDLDSFGFVPGEVVTLKFKLGKARNIRSWENKGVTFYFSMVYAYVERDLVPTEWQTLSTVSGLADVVKLTNNQRYLVDTMRRYDSPLRAALWDQITANASYASAYSAYNDEWRSYLERFGLDTDDEFLKHSVFAEEARYYYQKQFQNKDTIRIAYSFTANPATAASMQVVLPYEASSPNSYKIPRKVKRGSVDLRPFASNFPEWDQTLVWAHDFAGGSTAALQAVNQRPPLTADLAQTVYSGSFNLDSQDLSTLRLRRGFVRFYGTYSSTYRIGRSSITSHFFAGSGLYTGLGNGYQAFQVSQQAPSGFSVGDGIYLGRNSNGGSEDFGGFYYTRPSVLDGGTPYYSATSTAPIGLRSDLFLGNRYVPGAYLYSDTFNFTFSKTASDKYVPSLYISAISGLYNSALGAVPEGYANLSVQVKESANTGVSPNTTIDSMLNYTSAYNKSSYVSLFRLVEAAVFKSDYVTESVEKQPSFTAIAYSGLLAKINAINTRQNQAYAVIQQDDALRHTPLFWSKPKSMYRQYEASYGGSGRNDNLTFSAIDTDLVYFSQTRQADYLVVRGRNVTLGWGGFQDIYRDNPKGFFPGDLKFTFAEEQSIVGQDLQTVVIGLDSLKSLHYGQRYFIKGTVYYAAETMELP